MKQCVPKVSTTIRILMTICLQVLPTGKNIHALDPQSIPTTAAVASASVVVERLLKRQKVDNGNKWPETIAVVLWGTDNIKTYGESLAQVQSPSDL